MRKVKMLATWSDTGNTRGDIAGFPPHVAAMLVRRGLAVYLDDDKPKAKAQPAPAVDKMIKADTVDKKADEVLPPVEDKPKTTRRRRPRRSKPEE
jgi:hypothetical protein